MHKRIFVNIFLIILIPTIAHALYYIDTVNGNDNNNGSINAPWATLEKARDTIISPSTVVVNSGEYNAYTENNKNERTGYLSFVAAPGAAPIIDGMNISNSAYIEFNGFSIYSTSKKDLITISNTNNLKLANCKISSDRWSRNSSNLVTAMLISGSTNVEISNSKFFEIGRGVQIASSSNVTLNNNFITVKGGSGIQYLPGNTNVVIDSNHIRGEAYTPYPEDPLAFNSPHQSAISLRTGNITIKNNIIHGLGTSSGIMTYEPDAAGNTLSYDNILIENNSIYDISNIVLRFYNAGENISIRNNLLYSRIRQGECNGRTNDARYMYETALAVHNLAETSDGSGISLFNNIFIGAVFVPTTIREGNNIFWSLSSGGWLSSSPKGSSKIIVSSYLGCGKAPILFEDGTFFKEKIDMFFPEILNVDFLLLENSLANNFGEILLQPKNMLGSIGADGFIKGDGPEKRSGDLNNAGPYGTTLRIKPPEDFRQIIESKQQ